MMLHRDEFDALIEKYPEYFSFKAVGRIIGVDTSDSKSVLGQSDGKLSSISFHNELVVRVLAENASSEFEVECVLSCDSRKEQHLQLHHYLERQGRKDIVLIDALIFSIIDDPFTILAFHPELTFLDKRAE